MSDARPAKIEIEHGWYGCESGCCGMRATAYDGNGVDVRSKFDFEHYETEAELTEWIRGEWPQWADVPIEFGSLECSL